MNIRDTLEARRDQRTTIIDCCCNSLYTCCCSTRTRMFISIPSTVISVFGAIVLAFYFAFYLMKTYA